VDGVVGPVWQYEEAEIPMASAARLLVRVVIGKVQRMDQLGTIFESIPFGQRCQAATV
jgi:hypothetical protein